jgi:hypothetical protein
MTSELRRQTHEFVVRKQAAAEEARQMAALRILCGLDFEDVMQGGPEQRLLALRSVERLVERERLKGLRRHWAYDLNRHIALSQACEGLRRSLQSASQFRSGSGGAPGLSCATKNGVQGRRRS